MYIFLYHFYFLGFATGIEPSTSTSARTTPPTTAKVPPAPSTSTGARTTPPTTGKVPPAPSTSTGARTTPPTTGKVPPAPSTSHLTPVRRLFLSCLTFEWRLLNISLRLMTRRMSLRTLAPMRTIIGQCSSESELYRFRLSPVGCRVTSICPKLQISKTV